YLHRSYGGQFEEIECATPNSRGSDAQAGDFAEGLAREFSDRHRQLTVAGGGTLFIRHIDALPLPIQKTLVLFCEQPNAESPTQNQTVRIVCSSQTALTPMSESGSFLDDLYHRLTVFPVVTPALREHTDDIPALVRAQSQRLYEMQERVIQFDSDAMFALSRYPWPGNVDELFKLVERKTIQYPNSTVGVRQIIEDLFSPCESHIDATDEYSHSREEPAKHSGSPETVSLLPDEGLDLKKHLAKLEKELIELALVESCDVVAKAARRLRLGRTTMVEKMRRYDLRHQRHDPFVSPQCDKNLTS
ncbi:MAG: sigma 54-interacting transcriptional regulator, partial [Gammaproteobacteria bacterium]|nr:sigma 54-interacting transcriptional regulator [Gammaproteobacteria bacterium]